jgi:hypothetical protein
VVEARAYRTAEDERPGYGLAFEPVPGKTSFTRDSELQNCETSAWGRALIAVGAADAKKGIASAEDVQNRAVDNKPDALASGKPDAAATPAAVQPETASSSGEASAAVAAGETSEGVGTETYGEGVTVPAPSVDLLWAEARSEIGNTGAVLKVAAKLLGRSVSSSTITAEDLVKVLAAHREAA